MGKFTDELVAISRRKRSALFQLVSIFLGSFVFLFLLPWLLFALARAVVPGFLPGLPRMVEVPLAFIMAAVGLAITGWAAFAQWRIGHGTPAPVAPTQRLVITGPYKYCRNPIELGAILYYFAVGLFFGNVFYGLACFCMGLVFGSAYHRFVEEKELAQRFGEEYEQYRRSVPFLIPRRPHKD
jgi:protein-S-isoprenylcysteine O-methyltransferase Ste14